MKHDGLSVGGPRKSDEGAESDTDLDFCRPKYAELQTTVQSLEHQV